jgi:hypothetical protein
VRHDVGEAAQLGLHPPLRRHVGEEVDQSVPELGRALHEGAEHVAVAERGVVRDLLDPRVAGLADAHVVVEGTAAAHARQRLQQRVAIPGGGRQAERLQDRGIAVAEREVDDPALAVPHRPQDPHRLRKGVEQRAEAGRTRPAEELDELRIRSPWLRLSHDRRIRSDLRGRLASAA